MSVRRSQRGSAKLKRKLNSLINRDGLNCHYCGQLTNVEGRMSLHTKNIDWLATTIEHVIPHCEGGSFALTNLVIACYRCNNDRAKGKANE